MSPLLPWSDKNDAGKDSAQCEPQSTFDTQCRKLFCNLPRVNGMFTWIRSVMQQLQNGIRLSPRILCLFEVCRAFFSSVKSGLHTGKLQDDLKNIFSSKSTSTLHGRAGPFLRFLHFCSSRQLNAFPLNEDVVYAFMQSEEEHAAPTFSQEFSQLNGIRIPRGWLVGRQTELSSPNVIKGLSDKCYLRKERRGPGNLFG